MLIKQDSTNGYYYKVNAQIAAKAGLKSEAFTLYAKAHKLNSRDVAVMLELSELFLANDQKTEADSILHLAFIEDSTNIQTILSKAKMQYIKKTILNTARLLLKTKGRLDLNLITKRC